jgi:20S proteasome alpha/beta subunit
VESSTNTGTGGSLLYQELNQFSSHSLPQSSLPDSSGTVSSGNGSVHRNPHTLARIVVDDFLWMQQQQQQQQTTRYGSYNNEEDFMLDPQTEDSMTTTLAGRHLRAQGLELAMPALSSMNDGDSDDSSNQNMNVNSRYLSTGTTIAAVRGNNFVVLGADTRATAGTTVADTRATKIHKLAGNIYACGAGTSADLQHVTLETKHSVALQVLTEGTIGNANSNVDMDMDDNDDERNSDIRHSRQQQEQHVPVERVCRMLQERLYQQGGSCGANLIVGGVYRGNNNGNGSKSSQPVAVLTTIHPHGSMDLHQAYTALGSGGLAATAVLESRYKADMTLAEAVQLVQDAISAGISNDLGSGSQVDICIMTADSAAADDNSDDGVRVDYRRGIVPEEVLVPVPKREDDKNENNKGLSMAGVNGFGNLPFGIQSRRVLAVHQSVEQEWNDYLGISNSDSSK